MFRNSIKIVHSGPLICVENTQYFWKQCIFRDSELIRNLNACDHNLIIEKLISELKSANGQNIFFSSLFINIARETLVSTYLLHSTYIQAFFVFVERVLWSVVMITTETYKETAWLVFAQFKYPLPKSFWWSPTRWSKVIY